jgi:hypothetical protein
VALLTRILMRIGAAALLLCRLATAAAAAQGDGRAGEVVQAAPRVEGRRADVRPAELKPRSPVFVGMEIETFPKAGALIAINRDLPQQRGAVTLGSRTTVELTERLVNEAQGLAKMSWLVKIGQFRLALNPPPPGAPLGEGEYMIKTPDGIEIRLQGTDVAVQVDKNGTTTVWVMEGEVTVTAAAGGVIQVPAGYGTTVRPGRAPEIPARFGTAGGPGPGLSPPPGETIFTDPPSLDLRAIRLDLPF